MENKKDKQVSSHTPGKITFDCYPLDTNIYSSTFGGIANINHNGKHKKEHELNAARIVKAWNEYDELKAENEKLKADKAVLLEALNEVKKISWYIETNTNKINEHTYKAYKEQILSHLEDLNAAIKQINK